MVKLTILRALGLAAITTIAVGSVGCTKKNQTVVTTPTTSVPPAIDSDPFALLPFGAVAVANLDARQIANSTAGGDLVALSERLLPFAKEIDFQVKRDLDHAYVGAYSFSGADTVAVLVGTFHPDKIEAASQKGLQTGYGTIVASTYAGRKLYTVANYGFTVLTDRTMLVGTEAAIRRALDRIQAGTIKREIAPWMSDWVNQQGYPVLVAFDVTKQSFGKTVTNLIPWIEGVQYVRVRGRFNPDGSFGMSGALTYPDANKAATSSNAMQGMVKSFGLMAVLKVIGIDPLVRNLTVSPAGKDVDFQTVIDEKSLRTVIHMATDWIGGGSPPQIPSPTPNGTGAPSGGGTTI